jgi:septum formation protein
MTIPVVLASESPRRRDLLRLIGLDPLIHPPRLDESDLPGEHPRNYAERLAKAKAIAVAPLYPGALIIAADTVVVLGDRMMGKPADDTEAAAMLQSLQGRTHTVHTGLAVVRGATVESAVESVEVTFRPLSSAQIHAYVATGEPRDKAGAYGIQGYGAVIVERIHGDFFAVMGLPLSRLVSLLARLGIEYEFGSLRERDR